MPVHTGIHVTVCLHMAIHFHVAASLWKLVCASRAGPNPPAPLAPPPAPTPPATPPAPTCAKPLYSRLCCIQASCSTASDTSRSGLKSRYNRRS